MNRPAANHARRGSDWTIGPGLACAVLTALVVLIFGQTLSFDFVGFDDPTYVSKNPRVLTGLTFGNVRWAATTNYFSNYHPITWWSYQLDVTLWGPKAAGFHATNLMLHLLNSCLLYGLLTKFSGSSVRSLVVATLFAIHPLHVESVAWISERKDLLSTLFGLLAIWVYLHHRGLTSWRVQLQVGGLFLLSLLSKQTLVTLPCLFLLLDFWPLNRLTWSNGRWLPVGTLRQCLVEKLPLLTLSVVFSAIIIQAQSTGGAMADVGHLSLPVRLANAVFSYTIYLWQTCVPLHLSCYYPYPEHQLTWTAVSGSSLLLVSITVICWQLRSRYPVLLVGWLWYLGTLLPMIGVIQVGSQAHADRYTYFPLIGIFILVVWSVADGVERGWLAARPVAYVAVLICGAVTAGAYLQTQVWQNTRVLAEHALLVTPRNAVAHLLLTNLSIDEGNLEAAEQHARAVMTLDPKRKEGTYNLGVVALRTGRHALAEASFMQAIELDPHYIKALRGLSTLQLQVGRPELAVNILDSALHSAPLDPELHFLRGVALEQLQRMDEARAAYLQVLALDAHHDLARNALRNLPSD